MARPRKPTNILKLSGAFKKNPQRAAERAREPKFTAGIGEMPDWLDTYATEEWQRVAAELDLAGVTSQVEATALACYCQAVSRLRKAEAEIFRDGITIMTEGGLKKHPSVTIAKEAMLVIRAFAAEFGMTPASRSKVQAKVPDNVKPMNEFAALAQ
jgi:P27 family predicted phage terminase small subunit